MSADGTPLTHNEPQFLGSGAPATAADLNLIAAYAGKVGNRKVHTTAERTALTGKDIWEGLEVFDSTLDRVFTYIGGWVSASTLDDTGWVAPTLTNSWVTADSLTVGYRRVNGVVYLRGRIANGTSNSAFTLPAGFRPAQDTFFAPGSDGGGTPAATRVYITSAGAVQVLSGTRPNLPTICFPADA